MKKIVLYGIGIDFCEYKEYLSQKYSIVGASDSNNEKGVLCSNFIERDQIRNIKFDYIVILVSKYYEEIKNDLIHNRGIKEEQIIDVRKLMNNEDDIIVVGMCGGMGNYLFKYALVKKLQSLYPNIPVKIDLSWYYLEHMHLMAFQVPWIFERLFNVKLEIASKKEILIAKSKGYYTEEESSKFDESILKQGSGYYDGYWQTGRYFDDIGDSIRKVLMNINDNAISYRQKKILEKIRNSESVAIWIRRGDYISTEVNRKIYGNICTNEYYKTAIDYIRGKYPRAEFFVFSNDEDYIKEKYNDMNIITYNVDSQEFKEYNIFLISQCKHIIGANSSMSWWASWLHGKNGTIIAPKTWINISLCPDVYEDNWIKM